MKTDQLLTLGMALAIAIAIIKWPRLWRMLRFPSSSSWPTQPATVERALVHSYSGRSGTTFRAEISYSYQTNGDYYAGYYKGDLCSSEAEVDDFVELFPKGTTVQIHVHPQKPQVSVLKV